MDSYLIDKPSSFRVVGVPVTALNFDAQINLMLQWAKERESRGICVANVHMLIEAHRNPAFASVLENADMVTPDGMPLVWMLRWLGNSSQNRVAGLDIMLTLCGRAIQENVSLFLLGSEANVLERMQERFQREFPGLQIAGVKPLPFRPLIEAENEAITHLINQSGAGIVLVSLGCPKQEAWIAQQQGKIQAVMIGLGGAFPVYAGLKRRAPYPIQAAGLEWLYRLLQEPGRLWGRYTSTIPLFLWLALKQLFQNRKHPSKPFAAID